MARHAIAVAITASLGLLASARGAFLALSDDLMATPVLRPPRDITLPDEGSTTAREVLSLSLRQLMIEFRGMLRALRAVGRNENSLEHGASFVAVRTTTPTRRSSRQRSMLIAIEIGAQRSRRSHARRSTRRKNRIFEKQVNFVDALKIGGWILPVTRRRQCQWPETGACAPSGFAAGEGV